MKYSEYLELVKAQLPPEEFICYAAEKVLERSGDNDNLKKHDENLREYINKLLKKEAAMRRASGDPLIPANTLNYVLGRPVGRSEKISARVSLLNWQIAYHKARGN